VPEYRLYLVGSDGHFVGCEEFEASNDEKAVEIAGSRTDSHDVELWERDRKVVFLSKK
jgi:hypothetical protein